MPTDRESDIVIAFVIGGMIGAAAGVLVARKGGRETLDVLYRRADALLTRAQNDYEKAAEKIQQAYDAIRRCRGELPQ